MALPIPFTPARVPSGLELVRGGLYPGAPPARVPPPFPTGRFGLVRSPAPVQLVPQRHVAIPRSPRPAPPLARRAGGPRPPMTAAARGGKATAASIPTHAKTGAVKSQSLSDATPAAKARAQAHGGPPRRSAAFAPPVQRAPSRGPAPPTAAELVQQALAPAYLENTQAQQAQQAADEHNRAVRQQYTQALMNTLGGVAPAVQGDYDHALAQQTALATQGAAGLAAANPNADTQALLAAIGAPPEQRQQITDQNRAVFQGGAATTFARQGLVPGDQFAQHGAAATAFARGLPAVTALQGAQIQAGADYQSGLARQRLLDARAGITARGPGLLGDIRASSAAAAQKNQALAMEARALGLKTQNQRFQQGATVARLQQGSQRLGLASNAQRLAAARAQASQDLALQRLGIADKAQRLQVLKTQQQFNQKHRYLGLGPAEYGKRVQTAGLIAERARHGFTDKPGTAAEKVYPALPWAGALKEMQVEGIPLQIALPELGAQYPPGVRGRPKTQIRVMLKRLRLGGPALASGVQ